MGETMINNTPESLHPNWPFQEADVQLLEIGTLSQVKQAQDGWNAYGQKDRKKG